jgi:hypothetical protein
MKKIFLIIFLLLYSITAAAKWSLFKKKEEVAEPVIKVCYYYLEHSDNKFAIFSVFQEECSGIMLRGIVSGRKIIEYNDDLGVKNMQNPLDDATFREKVERLWPDMRKIEIETK